MQWGSYLLCGWPGLPGLWFKGQTSSLVVAIGFSILLNLALISSFIWPNSLGETFPLIAWPIILLIWSTSTWVAYQSLSDVMAVPVSEKVAQPERPDTLFVQAQREYLGGHWEEAESLLRRRIERQPRDMEARLLLATLLRHTRRLEDASNQLIEMQRFDNSQEWNFEIDREVRLIELIAHHEMEVTRFDQSDDEATAGSDTLNDGFIRKRDIDPAEMIERSLLNKLQLDDAA